MANDRSFVGNGTRVFISGEKGNKGLKGTKAILGAQKIKILILGNTGTK